MKLSSSLAAVLSNLLLARITLAVVSPSDIKRVTTLPTVTNRFIIEVEDATDIPTKRTLGGAPHKRFYAALDNRAIGYTVDKEFDSEIFVGASLTLDSPEDVAEIASIEGIKAVRPVRAISRPSPVRMDILAEGDTVDVQSTHVITGVDKLHAQGIFGAGIKIGIIDTGIDYMHPALGGGFGPGFKVARGYDFVGDDYTGGNEPVPDDDPLDQCAGHGTHVAGILGADPSNPYNISGVAYESELAAYRVFGCQGYVTDDVLVDAMLLAFEDGADVITLSIGGPDGWTEGTGSVVASRIAEVGKVVTIAAGNAGDSGSWYTSGPSNGINVISVASLDNTALPLQNATVGGIDHDPITYYSQDPLPILETLPLYVLSNDTTIVNDACSALPASTPDLSTYLVLVRRGSCSFNQKMLNIAAKGAEQALIYDNGNGFVAIDLGATDVIASLIQSFDGESLVAAYAAGESITITFPQSGGSVDFPFPEGGLISSFSSYGPSNDFYFKPAVAAPGGNILSTLPLDSYGLASGTSMATPFVAGSAALLLSVKGNTKEVALSARSLFESTANPVSISHTDGDPLQTLTQQGAGLIDVFDAIFSTTTVSPTELILNDTAHFEDTFTLTITNGGSMSKDYTISNLPAGTALTVEEGTVFPALGPVPISTDYATATFSKGSFTLGPGESTTVTVEFSPPTGVDAELFPVFSGFIQVISGSEIVHASYLGLGASLYDKDVIDDTDYYFGVSLPFVLDGFGDIQRDPANYTFVDNDYPSVVFRFLIGIAAGSWDLVPSDVTSSNAIESSLGSLASFEYLPRNDIDSNGYYLISITAASFENGTAIEAGRYKFLLKALKVTGDPSVASDYETWLSPIIGVV